MPFLTDLRANLNLGYDYQHGENYSNPFVNTPAAWNGGYQVLDNGTLKTIKDGGVDRKYEFQTRVNLLLGFYLNYNRYFEDIKSTLDVTAGYSWQKFHNKKREYNRVYQVVDPANEKYLGTQANPTGITIHPHQLVSFFGRANFTFLDKYLFTATVRRDGTSRFSKDHRWGTFPSVALAWKLLEGTVSPGSRTLATTTSPISPSTTSGQAVAQSILQSPVTATVHIHSIRVLTTPTLNGRKPIH